MMKSMYKAFLGLVLAVCCMVSIQSCKPTIPSKYLSKGEMTDILYDIHVAEAMSINDPNGEKDGDMITYREAILKKHGVTPADFDSSMVYYMRHTKLMHDVYTDLADRLTDEAQSLGADVSDASMYGNVSMGDTANVWNGARSIVLSTYEPFNYYSFEVPVDTAFRKGDKLMLDFDAQFIFQDGMRDGIAMLAITFKNDSVASSSMHITNTQHYSLQVEDRDSLGIKSVKGYFLLTDGDFGSGNSSMTTLKMMFLQNIKLVRFHAQKPVTQVQNANGSSSADSASSASGSGSSQASESSSGGPNPVLSSPSGRPVPPPEQLHISRDANLPKNAQ